MICKPMLYPPEVTEDLAACWRETEGVLHSLPKSSDTAGRERRFAGWMPASLIESIHQATQDELSHLLSGSMGDLERFSSRPATEPIVDGLVAVRHLDPDMIERTAGLCVGLDRQTVRTKRKYTQADGHGRRNEFLDPAEVPAALALICETWNEAPALDWPLMSALWILVSTLNTHPFKDGNGRLARALANAVLIRSGLSHHGPLPLGPLAHATRGNFKIAANRAAFLQDWMPISRVFATMIHFYRGSLDAFERAQA